MPQLAASQIGDLKELSAYVEETCHTLPLQQPAYQMARPASYLTEPALEGASSNQQPSSCRVRGRERQPPVIPAPIDPIVVCNPLLQKLAVV